MQSKAYALFCEAQYVLKMPRHLRRDYLEIVEKQRGAEVEVLKDEIRRWHRPVAKAGAAVHPVENG